MSYESYEKHFGKHIVMSCDNPKLSKTIKSCRKSKSISKKNVKR